MLIKVLKSYFLILIIYGFILMLSHTEKGQLTNWK